MKEMYEMICAMKAALRDFECRHSKVFLFHDIFYDCGDICFRGRTAYGQTVTLAIEWTGSVESLRDTIGYVACKFSPFAFANRDIMSVLFKRNPTIPSLHDLLENSEIVQEGLWTLRWFANVLYYTDALADFDDLGDAGLCDYDLDSTFTPDDLSLQQDCIQ